MAATVTIPYVPSKTVFVVLIDKVTGNYWNSSTLAFEVWQDAHAANYALATTAQGSSGNYTLAFPAAPAGFYDLFAYVQAGASPVLSDYSKGTVTIVSGVVWNGSAEVYASGDPFVRLGTPAGASIAADIANVVSQVYAQPIDGGTFLKAIQAIAAALAGNLTQAADGSSTTILPFLQPGATTPRLTATSTATNRSVTVN